MAAMLAMLFEKIAVYQPLHQNLPPEMQQLKQKGFLDIRTPEIEDDHAIQAVIKDYQNWARLHQGRNGLRASFLKTLDSKVPFFDDSAPSRILADIKSDTRSETGRRKEDPLLRARLFLHFAQEYDRRNLEIETELSRYEEMAQNLINVLKAEEDERLEDLNKTSLDPPGAPDDFMLSGRFSAWTRMLLQDPKMSHLFITPSLSAFEFVKNLSADVEVVFHTDAIPIMNDPSPETRKWQQSLLAHLCDLSQNDSSATIQAISDLFAHQGISQTAALTICRVSGLSPHEFFAYAGNLRTAAPEITLPAPGIKNILIILVFSKKKC